MLGVSRNITKVHFLVEFDFVLRPNLTENNKGGLAKQTTFLFSI